MSGRVVRWATCLLLAACLAPLLARFLPPVAGPLVVLVAATPYVSLLALPLVVLAVWSRRRALVAASALVALLAVGIQLPMYVADGPRPEPLLRVASLNVSLRGVDPAEVIRLVDQEQPDVLVLVEVPGETQEALAAGGLGRRLPYAHVATRAGYAGTGMWSRFPLDDPRRLDGFRSPHLAADLTAGGTRMTVVAVHPAQPRIRTVFRWRDEQERLRAALTAMPGTVVAVGDFNATHDHASIRALGEDGFTDAAGSAGAGIVRTWPVDLGIPGPLFGLDRVLSRGLTGVTVRTRAAPGTDHLAIVAELGPS